MDKKYSIINIRISLILIFFYLLKLIYAQLPGVPSFNDGKCKEKGERGHPRGFSDCNTESTSDIICCYLTGTQNGEKYEGCKGMDMIVFANKSFSYEIKDISATLICDANYNNDFYYKYNAFFYILLLILIILL